VFVGCDKVASPKELCSHVTSRELLQRNGYSHFPCFYQNFNHYLKDICKKEQIYSVFPFIGKYNFLLLTKVHV